MSPNLRAAKVALYDEMVDETCRHKPTESPGRGAVTARSILLPISHRPTRGTIHLPVPHTQPHNSTTDNTHVSSTNEARYTSRSYNQAGDLLARTTLHHSRIDTDTDDALDAEKVTPTRPCNWQVQQPYSVPTSKQQDGHQDPSRRQRER